MLDGIWVYKQFPEIEQPVFDDLSEVELQRKYKKNKEFLLQNSNNIKRRFYHCRDIENHPKVTVCVLYDLKLNIFCRGISICNYLESPRKEFGRDSAEDRAILAYKTKKSDLSIRPEVQDYLDSFIELLDIQEQEQELYEFSNKSEYNITPTKFEKKLFKLEV